jgi:hypothetical protein
MLVGQLLVQPAFRGFQVSQHLAQRSPRRLRCASRRRLVGSKRTE